METQVVFLSQQQVFCLPIGEVEKIIKLEKITGVPNRPSFILGVIDYGESVLPIIDLAGRLYQKVTVFDSNTKIIIVQAGAHLVGLLVEEVLGIQEYQVEQYLELEEEQFAEESYVAHFIKSEGQLVLQLEVEQLLSSELALEELISEQLFAKLNTAALEQLD